MSPLVGWVELEGSGDVAVVGDFGWGIISSLDAEPSGSLVLVPAMVEVWPPIPDLGVLALSPVIDGFVTKLRRVALFGSGWPPAEIVVILFCSVVFLRAELMSVVYSCHSVVDGVWVSWSPLVLPERSLFCSVVVWS